jgi:hypothetical protein
MTRPALHLTHLDLTVGDVDVTCLDPDRHVIEVHREPVQQPVDDDGGSAQGRQSCR